MQNDELTPEDRLDIAQDTHQGIKEFMARAGWIRWRMGDVPGVYHELMPYSVNAKELWTAEKAIRAQMIEDQKLIESPWRKVGPLCAVIDWSKCTAQEKITIGIEVSIPVGLEDAPKPDRREEVLSDPDIQERIRAAVEAKKLADAPPRPDLQIAGDWGDADE